MNYLRKVLLLVICALLCGQLLSQSDSSRYLVGAYYGLGVSNPMGSFSKTNANYNDIGKAGIGLNMKAGLEVFVTKHDAVSIDMDYGIFQNITNDSMGKVIKRRVNSYKTPYIRSGSGDGEIILSHVCVSYSRFFYFNRFVIQPKIGVGRASFSYDFGEAYLFTNALSPTVIPTTTVTANSVAYAIPDVRYFTLKPEVTFKYILKKGKHFDFNLAFGISYFYAKPSAVLVEEKDSSASTIMILNDKVQSLNLNLGVNLVIKKSLFQTILN